MVNKVINIANIREMIEDVIKLEIDENDNNNNNLSVIPNYYPFPTPITESSNIKLVELLKKYNKWEQIQSMQSQIS